MVNISHIPKFQFMKSEESVPLVDLPLLYTIFESIVAVGAFIGNLLVIIVFIQDKRLRKVTNFYIISLAIADLFVGLIGIPSAILTRMGIPRNSFRLCLTMLTLLVVLCTISILNLVAVSLDRYWAILHPLDYHRRISERTAMFIIISCWIIGALIGFLPLFGWNNGSDATSSCLFIPVMSYDFLVFLYFATIVLPALTMAFFYGRIYLVVMKQLSLKKVRQISTFESVSSGHYSHRSSISFRRSTSRQKRFETNSLDTINYTSDNNSGGSPDLPKSRSLMTLKNLNNCTCIVKPIKLSYSRREVKKAQKLFIIVVFFMLCWIPLYTSNTVQAFCKDCQSPPLLLIDFLIILSHVNSVGSPFLYAFHMKDFREALRRLLCKCAIRQQHLRDLRRQELFSISGIPTRRTAANTELFGNTPEITPELSPNLSLNMISNIN